MAIIWGIRMRNKTGLITSFLTLLACAIASIIMYIRGYELTRMLWGLLIVLIIFYILGDIARYLYSSIRPRILPTRDIDRLVKDAKKNHELTVSVVAFEGEGEAKEGIDADGFMSEDTEGYSDADLGYSDDLEEYADEENYGEG